MNRQIRTAFASKRNSYNSSPMKTATTSKILSSPQESNQTQMIQIIETRFATSPPITDRLSEKAYIPYVRRGTSSERYREKNPVVFDENFETRKEFENSKYCGYFHPIGNHCHYTGSLAPSNIKISGFYSASKTRPVSPFKKYNDCIKLEQCFVKKRPVIWKHKSLCDLHKKFTKKDPKFTLNDKRLQCGVNYKTNHERFSYNIQRNNIDFEELDENDIHYKISDTKAKILEKRNRKIINVNNADFEFFKNFLKGSIKRVRAYVKLDNK